MQKGPGCWAYPDMLEVGNMPTFNESRSHFGAWCIVSAPLILGHDLANTTLNAEIWPIITNKHAIAVSKSWAGHPGSLISSVPASSEPRPGGPSGYLWGIKPDPTDATQHNWIVPVAGSTGPLRHGAECVTIPPNSTSEISLLPCSGSPEQTFAIDPDGGIHIAGDTSRCLAIARYVGPGVVRVVSCCF